MGPRRGWAAASLLAACVLATAGCGGPGSAAQAEPAASPDVDTALHDRLPTRVRDAGVLVVGTDPSYAPMSSYAADGRTIVGMEPDLAADLGDLLGVEVEIEDTPFDEIIDQVEDGRIDLGMTAMTDTPERARRVDFVDYFVAGTAILVQRGNPDEIGSLGDLCGTVVAVEQATIQIDLIARQQDRCRGRQIQVEEYATNSDALLRLRTGRVSAVLNDLPPAALLAEDRRTRSFYELATREQYEPGFYGIAVRRSDERLRAVLTDALERLVADGHYDRTLRTWGLEAGAVDEVLVNAGR
ncbi:MAG: ABC transporter substrate-binding protein [Nocardioidaceae bacterium]|nr:ABC transporter substrate-binding protein [Nocardioidaceae bacterium]